MDCHVPTTSCAGQLMVVNALVATLHDRISSDAYKTNHPAGNIGRVLTTVGDKLVADYPVVAMSGDQPVPIHDVLIAMTSHSMGCCCFTDAQSHQLLGIMTDGDIRRLLIRNADAKVVAMADINAEYYSVSDLAHRMQDLRPGCTYVPVLQKVDNLVLGMVRSNFAG